MLTDLSYISYPLPEDIERLKKFRDDPSDESWLLPRT